MLTDNTFLFKEYQIQSIPSKAWLTHPGCVLMPLHQLWTLPTFPNDSFALVQHLKYQL